MASPRQLLLTHNPDNKSPITLQLMHFLLDTHSTSANMCVQLQCYIIKQVPIGLLIIDFLVLHSLGVFLSSKSSSCQNLTRINKGKKTLMFWSFFIWGWQSCFPGVAGKVLRAQAAAIREYRKYFFFFFTFSMKKVLLVYNGTEIIIVEKS